MTGDHERSTIPSSLPKQGQLVVGQSHPSEASCGDLAPPIKDEAPNDRDGPRLALLLGKTKEAWTLRGDERGGGVSWDLGKQGEGLVAGLTTRAGLAKIALFVTRSPMEGWGRHDLTTRVH